MRLKLRFLTKLFDVYADDFLRENLGENHAVCDLDPHHPFFIWLRYI
jgi:hypothetical protein